MKNLNLNHISNVGPPHSRTRRAGWPCWAAAGLRALLCSLLLMTATMAVQAADQFVQVTHPGWTNSSQYSWTGAWGDYDKDGFIDLFVPNTTATYGAWTNFLYHNNGDGTFTQKFADEVGPIASANASWGGYWGDVNNDGFLDLLVVSEPIQVFLNQGNGTFRSAGAGGLSNSSSINGTIAWADYDNDGNLDVFVRSMAGKNRLFRGRGDGTFDSVTNSVIASAMTSDALDATWGDFNNDGKPDLIVANYTSGRDFFYRNDGHGQFTRMTNSILEKPGYQTLHHAWGDYDNDGFLDLAAGNGNSTRLFRNNGSGDFVVATNWPAADWATPVWGDYDNDGYLDLLVIRGQASAKQLRLFHNNGDGTFNQVEDVFTRPSAYWLGGGWGDYDNDGFLDLFVAETHGNNALYHNLGNTNHWIKFQLAGVVANRTAIGAKVRVKATIGGKTFWQMREVSGGNVCQNDLRPNFGLGDATNVDIVRIEWPSGNVQELADVTPNQIVAVKEAVNITPTNPSSSLNGSVTLNSQLGGPFQWQFDGADLVGETNRILKLTNLQANQAGRYSVVATAVDRIVTNYVYLTVDPTFTKIVTGPIVSEGTWAEACSWGDLDGDGRIDLFVARSGGQGGPNLMYQNQGDGLFVKVTNVVTRAGAGLSIGNAWADYDNNGTLDLFVGECCGGPDKLFRNDGGGSFTRLPSASFLPETSTTRAVAWADYDLDGNVDLFVANEGGKASLYHNNGDGTFKRITDSVLVADVTDAIGCSWCDYDGDGYPDLFVANYSDLNRLYHNNRDGSFSRITSGAIVKDPRPSWGCAWGDYDNDGFPDLFVTRPGSTNSLYHNNGDGTFTQVLTNSVATTQAVFAFAGIWGDYDNDGYLDLFVANFANGGIGENNFLFRNDRQGGFTRITTGSLVNDQGASTGSAWGDYDDDGFLDLAVVNWDGSSRTFLYRNNGNTNHWLKLKLVGTASNRAAIGAKVRVKATIWGKSLWQLREISGGGGYASQNDLRAHFGLGDATNVDLVRIEWPSGNVQELSDQTPNQMLKITEPLLITPAIPSSSLGGSVTLISAVGNAYQWQFNGVDLTSQTSRTLILTNIQASQQGRYSVVVTTGDTTQTNYTYVHVDTQFTKITTGPVVTDQANTWGCVWGDYDNDGFIDLLIVNDPAGATGSGPQDVNFLYHNNGDGTFARVTTGPFMEDKGHYDAAAWADVNNDGWLDLYAADATRWYSPNATANHLFYVGLGGGAFAKLNNGPASSAIKMGGGTVWGDFDNDGLVDLFVVSGTTDRGTKNCLFRNTGDCGFLQLTNGPVATDVADSESAAASDYDGDGDLDLLVSCHSIRLLYQNNGDGTFTRITNGPIALDSGNSAGLAWGDYDNDGEMDLCLATFDERLHLFHNDGGGKFTRILLGPVGNYQRPTWVDYDNDGWLDLYITHAYLSGERRNRLYHNNGDGTFTEVKIGSLPTDGGYSCACAWADYDNNGFLDLVVGNSYQTNTNNFLYRNNGNGNHWLAVKLVGTASNRSAIGAKVRVKATIGGKTFWQMREISGGRCTNQDDLRAYFGLGTAANVTTLRIEWPSGAVQELTDVAAKQILTVWEPPALRGAVVADGACQLTVTAEPNRPWRIESSTDLVHWQLLASVTSVNVTFQYTDTAASGIDCRFYRVVAE